MSIDAIGAVLRRSKSRGNRRMVLVVIAECANHDWGGAYPAVDTIADRAGIDKRTTQRCIQDLVAEGELVVEKQAGPKGCNLYQVTLPGDDSVSGRQPDTPATRRQGVTAVSPEPSKEPSTAPPKEPPAEEAAFVHWQRVLDKPRAQLTPGRRRKLRARLEHYPVERILRAIDGCAASTFHIQNEHTDLTLICRSDEQLERFESLPLAGGPPRQRDGTTVTGGGLLSSRSTCKRCPTPIDSRQANVQSGLCDPCYAKLVEAA